MQLFKECFVAVIKAFHYGLGPSVHRAIEDGEDWKDKLFGAIFITVLWFACMAFCALALAAYKA
jgi:hypothetical protein